MRLTRKALLLLLLLAAPLHAAVFIVPPDEDLIRDADAIVVVRAANGVPQILESGDIATDTTFEVIEVLKGNIDNTRPLVVRDLGGTVGLMSMGVSGGVQHSVDERMLLFLQKDGKGWTSYGMSMGKFCYLDTVTGAPALMRWVNGQREVLTWTPELTAHNEMPRDADAFLDYIRRVLKGRHVRPSRYSIDPGLVIKPLREEATRLRTAINATGFAPSAYTQGAFRWAGFDTGGTVTFRVSNRQPGYDDLGAAQRALAAWTNEPNSNVRYSYGGTSTAGFVKDNQNTIVYNSASDVPAGAIGYARWYSSGTHPYKNETFNSNSEGDVVMRSGLSITQTQFDEAVTHEVGHTLGFRHSEEGTPASSAGVMHATITGQFGATLGQWDIDAVTTVYEGPGTPPPPPTCTVPSITVEPAGRTIVVGEAVTLTASIGGTSPSIQWYQGVSGNTSAAISGATGATITVSPSLTTSYWARATNSCGAANSNTATIGVMPAQIRNFYFRADFNGDGNADTLIRNTRTGEIGIWLMTGATVTGSGVAGNPGLNWRVVGAGDFDGNGRSDILIQNNDNGDVGIWFMSGTTITSSGVAGRPGRGWAAHGAGDINGDGRADIIIRNLANGDIGAWLMSGVTQTGAAVFGRPGTSWIPIGMGDFNADGRSDMLIRNNTNGDVGVWLLNGLAVTQGAVIGTPGLSWMPMGTADMDANGRADVILQNSSNGDVIGWLMNGFSQIGSGTIGRPGLNWRPVNAADLDRNGTGDIIFQSLGNGDASRWQMSGLGIIASGTFGTPGVNWIVVGNR
jgi:hypothetical protein